MITSLSHVGKHRSSLYQASALGPPHKCLLVICILVNKWFSNAEFQKFTFLYTIPLIHTQQITQYKVYFCTGFLSTSVLRTCHTHFCEPVIFTHNECMCAIWKINTYVQYSNIQRSKVKHFFIVQVSLTQTQTREVKTIWVILHLTFDFENFAQANIQLSEVTGGEYLKKISTFCRNDVFGIFQVC